ncbi:dnaJ homolog subfamily B member 13 [Tribolium castaneum]|uniref:DnaJ protein homolog 1-like Protein n=1 Tax=Tribolium castaneum TaxID=7070 RepID=D6WN02_TRICA|nr:PREDICTED: dnaJ homolog subfamily B member 13 [Tribolium castaneum]EFA03257.1 DnaJ protein homolog 1-like Protein [Tribolium castaneum]|eukprot:XP_969979.1 PREDICTED: dnaJ homolog subfamily B member 13 [Tribolium castaneum]
MGIDFYGVLQIPRSSTNLDIKKAFRDLALEFNPEKLQGENAQQVFSLICEAYDVLSDPLRRSVFDQYGEEGLKRGVPGPDSFIEPYRYHGDPMRTYKDFFGTTSPYANLLDYLRNPSYECMTKHGKIFCEKQPPITHPLHLTLHEIFFGGIKKMKIHRLVYINDEKTKTKVKEKILTIPIKPGVRPGTELVFPEEGDQSSNHVPADVIFVVQERPHEVFQREEDNLAMMCSVTLEEALMGTTVTVNTIDHRTVRVPITDVIFPGYEKIVENEGMPVLDDYPKRGNLIIRFDIAFPKYLPKACKHLLRKGFQLAKIGGGVDQYETVNKLVLADKILRVDLNEQMPP